MKETNCDAILLLPDTENYEETTIQGLTYKDKGDRIGHNEMGNFYDIMTFRQIGEKSFGDKEHVQAILVCPYTYAERLFKEGYYGLISIVTTTSHEMFESISDKINILVDDESN